MSLFLDEDAAEMRNFVSSLVLLMQRMQHLRGSMTSTMQVHGEYWRDSRFEEFRTHVECLLAKLQSTQQESEHAARYLSQRAELIQEYLNARKYG